MGEQLRPLLQDDFAGFGLELTRFYMKAASILSEEEFSSKKAELLARL